VIRDRHHGPVNSQVPRGHPSQSLAVVYLEKLNWARIVTLVAGAGRGRRSSRKSMTEVTSAFEGGGRRLL